VKLCRKIPKKRYLVLFSDSIMYGERDDPKGKVKYHRYIPLSSKHTIKDLPDDLTVKRVNGFQIITSEKSFIAFAETPEEKRSWMKAINNVILRLSNIDSNNTSSPIFNDNNSSSIHNNNFLHTSVASNDSSVTTSVTSDSTSNSQPVSEDYVAPVWVHDKEKDSCMLCATLFTVIKRRVSHS
jgi:hypothetical protein